jgi:hypothetical protein
MFHVPIRNTIILTFKIKNDPPPKKKKFILNLWLFPFKPSQKFGNSICLVIYTLQFFFAPHFINISIKIDWLISYGFTSRSRIFHLYGEGLWAGRDLYRATPAATRDLVFFRSHPKDRPIQSPLTTHKGLWRTYSNPDPHGGIKI